MPTEAEWEYADRAGAMTKYYWSDEKDLSIVDKYAWYYLNADEKTHPGVQKLPNAFGLYAMSGNVTELLNDWYSDTYYSSQDTLNHREPSSGEFRCTRSGVWLSDHRLFRVARRALIRPGDRGDNSHVHWIRCVLGVRSKTDD